METYSRDKQDLFIIELFGTHNKGVFVDIGCQYPIIGNNTYLLEKCGWFGMSLDIEDYENQWKIRNTPFIRCNALKCDYKELFLNYNITNPIDYLSLDVEGNGDRYNTLIKVFESNFEFKVITIEHDAYLGFEESERKKQREFLLNKGYVLICEDVMCIKGAFEDWWINPKYVKNIMETKFRQKFPNEIVDGLSDLNAVIV